MYKRLMFHKFKKEHQIQHFPYNHWGEKGLYSGRGIQIYFSQSCFRFYKKKSFETRVGVKNYDSAHTWHYSFDSWVGVNLHAKRKWFIVALSHVTSIVGKCALFYVLKRWLIAKTLMVFFCLASACEWVSEISSKLFPNRRFFVFKRPSHLTLYKITTRNKQRIYSKWISLSILLKSQEARYFSQSSFSFQSFDQNMTVILVVVRLASGCQKLFSRDARFRRLMK